MSSETREIMHDQHSHPVHGTKTYWTIGVILFFVTALEILAYYMEESLGPMAVPVILALSAAKFALVVMFFMHLKYDSKVFTGIFLFPFALATLVIVSLFLLYHLLHPLR
jgi:cytochrome c oxidase subunit IV